MAFNFGVFTPTNLLQPVLIKNISTYRSSLLSPFFSVVAIEEELGNFS
jgi:hypothetical protein